MFGLFVVKERGKEHMVSVECAKKIGITFCAEKMGRDFVEKFANSSSTGFSEDAGSVFCFLGINDNESELDTNQNLRLTNSIESFPYRASCDVILKDGRVRNFKYIHP